VSDGGVVTAEVNGFTVSTNSGVSESQLRQNLKPKADEAASQAGKELGKRGGEAAAKAREAKAAEESEEKPEAKPIKPIPPKKEAAEPEKVEAKPAEEEKAEPEEKPEEAPPEKDKRGDPRHDPKARMLEATRKEAEAKRALAVEREKASALEARLNALERQTGLAKAEPEAKREGNGKPTPQDFDTYEDYLDARDSYNRSQWEAETQRRAQADAVDRALENHIGKFRQATVGHVDQYSDDVLNLKTEFQLSPGERPTGENWLANELVFSPESAPALMLHFTEHPEDLQRIAALTSPRAVSREMAKLEARLESATAGNSSEREVVSRAAPPVRPVAGKPYVTESDEYREGMTLDEYAKVWNKKNRLR
jgi:hypothetical protein